MKKLILQRASNGKTALFSKDEFYSTLKGKGVSEEEYANSKFLYKTLKVRDMTDLNDLYNAQDVIL